MGKPIKVDAERMSPEEETEARAAPVIRVKVTSNDPVPPAEVARVKRRAFAIGVALTAGAGVAAAVGYLIWGKRKPRRRKHA